MLGNKDLSVAWCCVTHTCAHIRTYACVRANVVASVFHSACFHVCFFFEIACGSVLVWLACVFELRSVFLLVVCICGALLRGHYN